MMNGSSLNFDNPFVTTGYVGKEYFCDREKETEDIVRLLTNGNNVALISPRRYGKTDLLRHCFAQRKSVSTTILSLLTSIPPNPWRRW